MKIGNIKIFLMLAAALALLPAFFVFAETSVAQVTVYSTPAPTGLAASDVSMSSVALSWDSVAGASAYRIYINDVLAGQISTTTYSASALSPNTLYSFRVSSLDVSSIESALSSAVATTTLPLPYVPPTTPATSTPVSGGFVPALGQVVPPSVGIITSFKVTYGGSTSTIVSKQIILNIKAPGATHIQTSADPSFKNVQWVKFSPEIVWELPAGPGNKVIYLRLQSQKEAIKTIFVESKVDNQKSISFNDLVEAIRKSLKPLANFATTTVATSTEKNINLINANQPSATTSTKQVSQEKNASNVAPIVEKPALDEDFRESKTVSSSFSQDKPSVVPVSFKTAVISFLLFLVVIIVIILVS